MDLKYGTVLNKHTWSNYDNTTRDVDSHYNTLHHILCRNDVRASSIVINIWFYSPWLLNSDIYVWLVVIWMDGWGGGMQL